MSKERILTTQAFPYSTRTADRGSFRLPGAFGRWPIVGLTMFVLAGLVFTMIEILFQGGKKQHVRTK